MPEPWLVIVRCGAGPILSPAPLFDNSLRLPLPAKTVRPLTPQIRPDCVPAPHLEQGSLRNDSNPQNEVLILPHTAPGCEVQRIGHDTTLYLGFDSFARVARIWGPNPHEVMTSGGHTDAQWAECSFTSTPGLVLSRFGSPCSARAISLEHTRNTSLLRAQQKSAPGRLAYMRPRGGPVNYLYGHHSYITANSTHPSRANAILLEPRPPGHPRRRPAITHKAADRREHIYGRIENIVVDASRGTVCVSPALYTRPWRKTDPGTGSLALYATPPSLPRKQRE